MSIDLTKKAEQIQIILDKKGLKQAPIMRVGAALDISGSMDMRSSGNIISSGGLQKAFNQMMGVSVKFDDNGELDVFKFDNSCEYVGTSKPVEGDYDVFIEQRGIKARGGTCYAPIVTEAIKFFFPEAKKSGGFFGFGAKEEAPASTDPVLLLILTDGEPSDFSATKRAMQEAEKYPIYFHMVGIGDGNNGRGGREGFPTIARLADDLPNVGEVYLGHFDLPDAQVYDQLICDELVGWVANFSKPVFGRRATV